MRKTVFLLALAIASILISPIAALSHTTTLSYTKTGSEDGAVFAGVQAGSEIRGGDFVNKQATATSPPQEDFQDTALSAANENSILGDVFTTGSYADTATTLSTATTAGESSKEEGSSLSGATTTPVLFAAAAACVVAIGAIAIVKKRANMRVPSPHTPVDKTIYYHVEVGSTVNKPGHFHVNRQLTPPV